MLKLRVREGQEITPLLRRNREPETKKPAPFRERASVYGLAVTYFRVRLHTSIGANPFHCPVRDGKEWFQAAMAAR